MKSVLLQNISPPFKGFISTNSLVSINFANMCFLGPHLVPISLKIGSPSGTHFEKKVGLHGTWPQWNCNLSKLQLDKSKLQLDKYARFVANRIFVANTRFLGFFVQTFTQTFRIWLRFCGDIWTKNWQLRPLVTVSFWMDGCMRTSVRGSDLSNDFSFETISWARGKDMKVVLI